MEIRKGELFGLIGANGAGKSTLLKIIVGLLAPDQGEVTVGDVDVLQNPVQARKLIGYSPEEPILYDYLTGREFLEFVGKLRGMEKDRLDQRIAFLLGEYLLSDKADELIADYSHGMKQKISLCAALLPEPEVLLLDEPTNGLDALTAIRFKQHIRSLCNSGITVVFSSHVLETVEKISDRVGIIKHGKIVACDTLDALRESVGGGRTLEDIFIKLVQED